MFRTYLLGLGLALALFLSSQATAKQTGPQPDTDRRSEADKVIHMPERPRPQLCLDKCLLSPTCRSWTLVPRRRDMPPGQTAGATKAECVLYLGHALNAPADADLQEVLGCVGFLEIR
jgi:hypothetical protein